MEITIKNLKLVDSIITQKLTEDHIKNTVSTVLLQGIKNLQFTYENELGETYLESVVLNFEVVRDNDGDFRVVFDDNLYLFDDTNRRSLNGIYVVPVIDSTFSKLMKYSFVDGAEIRFYEIFHSNLSEFINGMVGVKVTNDDI
ncbi:hypothetical protein HYO65_gp146 [Tenacibaculum phage PTm1]|uniref:Uncharacterized protein n=2 Tax=Shirahamavirus PTm1 TaxID=2846435 RepID=A0A5S9HXJ0_9CAUD|nr:hypothetical protein HYO65_gp146 [Tenacibaculum phage PTm1]BBI90538.1 hypothetical protein [Tenacibaculum phage PTm1]BBI90846.1 hypothetical protein [Tenacibaculum phage PTm5]